MWRSTDSQIKSFTTHTMCCSLMVLPLKIRSKSNTRHLPWSFILISVRIPEQKMHGMLLSKPTKHSVIQKNERFTCESCEKPNKGHSSNAKNRTKDVLKMVNFLSHKEPSNNSIKKLVWTFSKIYKERKITSSSSNNPHITRRWKSYRRRKSLNSSECLLKRNGNAVGRRGWLTGDSLQIESMWLDLGGAMELSDLHQSRPKIAHITAQLTIKRKIYDLLAFISYYRYNMHAIVLHIG